MRLLIAGFMMAALPAADPLVRQDLYAESLRRERVGDYQGAASILAPMVDDYFSTLRRGWCLWEAGQWEGALEAYGSARRLRPQALEPRLGRVRVLLSAKRWAEAETTAREVLVEDPANSVATCFLAVAQAGAGRTDEALAVLATHLARYPSDTTALADHARLAHGLGRDDLAGASWRTLILLDPGHAAAVAGLAGLAAGR